MWLCFWEVPPRCGCATHTTGLCWHWENWEHWEGTRKPCPCLGLLWSTHSVTFCACAAATGRPGPGLRWSQAQGPNTNRETTDFLAYLLQPATGPCCPFGEGFLPFIEPKPACFQVKSMSARGLLGCSRPPGFGQPCPALREAQGKFSIVLISPCTGNWFVFPLKSFPLPVLN